LYFLYSTFLAFLPYFEDLLRKKTETQVRTEIEIQFMKDLEKELDDLYIRADITHEVSQIVISELKNNEKYINSSVIQRLKLSKHWFRSFMKNFGYGLRRNVGSTIVVPELKIEEEIKIITQKCENFRPEDCFNFGRYKKHHFNSQIFFIQFKTL
jgi:hypothetical protein